MDVHNRFRYNVANTSLVPSLFPLSSSSNLLFFLCASRTSSQFTITIYRRSTRKNSTLRRHYLLIQATFSLSYSLFSPIKHPHFFPIPAALSQATLPNLGRHWAWRRPSHADLTWLDPWRLGPRPVTYRLRHSLNDIKPRHDSSGCAASAAGELSRHAAVLRRWAGCHGAADHHKTHSWLWKNRRNYLYSIPDTGSVSLLTGPVITHSYAVIALL